MSKQTITEVFKNVFSAFIGVQNEESRKQAFANGSLSTYVIAGIIFTILFVGTIIFLVSFII